MLGENAHAPVSLNYERKNQDGMKDLFNFFKDIIYFKGLWKRTGMRAPLLSSSLSSFGNLKLTH